MKNDAHTTSRPPEPPEIARRVRFHRLQLVGMPLLLLLPVLALAGLFGESFHSVEASSSQLVVNVDYPTRFRYKMINPIGVSVENTSMQSLSAVRVHFDRTYIDSFSTVKFTPEVKLITDRAYVVEVTDLQPQETRVVTVEIQAEKYGRHQGTVTAVPANAESVTVTLHTLIFP